MKKKRLIFFTLSWNHNDRVLSHTIDWVLEAQKHFHSVDVYATHVNSGSVTHLPSNIQIHQLGGGNHHKRILGVFKLLNIFFKTVFSSRDYFIFYHMNVLPAIVLSPMFKVYKVRQGLWYSHKNAGAKLKFVEKFVNYCFSTSSKTFPLNSRKLIPTGHGLQSFWFTRGKIEARENTILVVGRIAPVKKIHELILTVAQLGESKPTIRLIGNVQDDNYLESLRKFAKKLDVTLTHINELSKNELKKEMIDSHAIFSGTDGSVDKAILEGGSCGCYMISPNPNVFIVSGEQEIILQQFQVVLSSMSLETQIRFFNTISDKYEIRDKIANECISNNSLENLMEKIALYANSKGYH